MGNEKGLRDTTRTYVELENPARQRLDDVLRESRLPLVALLTRLVEWFVHQPVEFQRAVCIGSPDATRELLKQQLVETADGVAPAVSTEQALAVIRRMADRIEQTDAVLRSELKAAIGGGKKKG